MVVEGVVVNGRVIAAAPDSWPEGSLVTVTLAEADELDAELDAMPIPPPEETHEEFLESIRQGIADIKAGVKGLSVAEAFAEVDAEFRRLESSGKCKP